MIIYLLLLINKSSIKLFLDKDTGNIEHITCKVEIIAIKMIKYYEILWNTMSIPLLLLRISCGMNNNCNRLNQLRNVMYKFNLYLKWKVSYICYKYLNY